MEIEDLTGEMPLDLITQALDDNGDGEADEGTWGKVQAAAEERLRSAFGGDVPARHALAAAHARKLFILVALYNRRGFTGEANPYTAEANRAEKRAQDLAAGDVSTDGGAAEPAFVGTPAKVAGLRGNMA